MQCCVYRNFMTIPFHSSLRGEALSYHEQKGRRTPQLRASNTETQILVKGHTYRGPMGTGTYRMVICLAMEALLDAPEAPMPAVAPAFFSKIFQNLRLSSAARGLLAYC